MESQPQNPEFRINPENFHPCLSHTSPGSSLTQYDPNFIKVRGHIAFCFSIQFSILRLLESQHQNPEFRNFVCLFVCFVALRPKSTAMVMAGQSVHLTTLFPGQA